jgi:N-acetylglucosamine malate deacetylase 1
MAAPRLLVLGAHPDDAEFHAGGLIARYRQLDREVKLVSVTNGGSGHHERTSEELVDLRRAEAAAAGTVVGTSYETWNFQDGELLPTLEVRWRIIREIREFAPDLVLTHRMCDYHPDHRAVAQAVQDACYMVKVPLVVPEVPAMREDPVVAFMTDLFTRPVPLRPDVVLDVTREQQTVLAMLDCHRSQVYEFLPYVEGILDRVPEQEEARREWLAAWFADHAVPRAERFRPALIERYGELRGKEIRFAEAYEISEYARQADAELLRTLFPETA